jgi:dTDP-4-dehydrorhamnose reductase
MSKNTILVLGANGMLGNAIFRVFSEIPEYTVYGTMRGNTIPTKLQKFSNTLVSGIDVEKFDVLVNLLVKIRPSIIINCIGVVKQKSDANNAIVTIPINSLLPHRLADLCSLIGARLIHFSTDCVFSGVKGRYTEDDIPDAYDLYGRSKLLGEVAYSHTLTIRTSLIGHELMGASSLICWFLSQHEYVKGFTHAIFSGLPTIEIANLLRDYVLPDTQLSGVYHVSADSIDKYSLLKLVSSAYNKEIEIIPDDQCRIDRSLDSSSFRTLTGYHPPSWSELVIAMQRFQ